MDDALFVGVVVMSELTGEVRSIPDVVGRRVGGLYMRPFWGILTRFCDFRKLDEAT